MDQPPPATASLLSVTSATHPRIILLVVGTIAFLAVVYLATMAACILGGINPPANVAQGFDHSGDVLLGALIGLLINTRTPPPGDPLAPKAAPQSAETLTQPQP